METHLEYLDLIRCTISLLKEEKRSYLFFDRKIASKEPITAAPVKIARPPPAIEQAPVIPKPVAVSLPPPVKIENIVPPSFTPPAELLPKPLPPQIVEVKKEEPSTPVEKKEAPPPALLPTKPQDDFEDLKRLLRTILPELPLLSKIPSDAEAKKIAQRYLYKHQAEAITILIHQEAPKEKLFLENLAKALDTIFPARITAIETIEKNNEWEAFLSSPSLKIIIACDYSIWEQKNLMKHYKEIPSRSETFLGSIPLFMLPTLSLYFKEPLLKRSLWKALCQKLSSVGSQLSS